MATKIVGDAELKAKLKKLKDFKQLVPALQASAKHVQGKISKYPSGNAHRPQPFKSAKQRAYFFFALAHGLIEVPYRRGQSPGSEDLGQSWTIKGLKDGLQQVIGNDTSYGPLVQGPGTQTAYHKGTGWKTTDEVAKDEEDTVLNFLKKQVDKILAS